MLQFKTVALPATEIAVKGKEMFTAATASKVVAPVESCILEFARSGWTLHSLNVIPATIFRKKGILEILFGWIPIIGALFQSKAPDIIWPEYYSLIFVREV